MAGACTGVCRPTWWAVLLGQGVSGVRLGQCARDVVSAWKESGGIYGVVTWRQAGRPVAAADIVPVVPCSLVVLEMTACTRVLGLW